MRVLHLAAGNRWTGAAAPAFAEVVALREAGVDAHYAFVGGYKLEGFGIQLFESIEGDYFTILGLPILPLLKYLRDSGEIVQ